MEKLPEKFWHIKFIGMFYFIQCTLNLVKGMIF
jgi:hypothetical protein